MAQYRDGTVTVTSNSATITGTDTKWVSAGIEPGHWFTVRGQGITYTVAAVLSDTQLVLSGGYQGTTQAGVYYLLHTDFTPRGYAVPGPNDVDATIIVRRAIYDIDADMTAALGAPEGARAIRVSDIVDLNSSTALTGQVMTKLASGSYGFVAPASLSVTLANLANSGTNIGQVYAGADSGGTHTFRALQVLGGTLAQNADRLTLTIPSPGETNTLSSVGTASSTSLVAPKSGSTLNVYGLRGANGVSIVRDGNDVLISGSGTGTGGTTTGEANTAENLGATGTNVVRTFSDKLGISLRFRSMLFNTTHFTVTGESTGQYAISARRQRLSESPDADLTGAVPGHILRLESDLIWRPQALPSAGIANLQADPAPRLGGNLAVSGNRIIGLAGTFSGMIEKPKAKTYTLILKAAAAISITSVSAMCGTGSASFSVFIGELPDDNQDTSATTISGTATSSGITDAIAGDPIQVAIGDRLSLRIVPQIGAEDFSFSIAQASA